MQFIMQGGELSQMHVISAAMSRAWARTKVLLAAHSLYKLCPLSSPLLSQNIHKALCCWPTLIAIVDGATGTDKEESP